VTRETDTLARVGGDEFYLIVNDASRPSSPDAAGDLPSYLMEVLRSNVEVEPCAFDFHEAHIHLHPRMSIGHAIFPEQAGNIDSLCSIADARMYENKRSRQASGASTISSGVASASSVVAAAGTARDSAKISHRMAAPSSH
jgi:diguanylate cyclase (GGDEF)-like protein